MDILGRDINGNAVEAHEGGSFKIGRIRKNTSSGKSKSLLKI